MDSVEQVFKEFNSYPWDSDQAFQEGLGLIQDKQASDNHKNLELLRAKHLYFSKFKQSFDLEAYLHYEAKEQEASFRRMEEYDFDNDTEYTNQLPAIIHNWLEQQSKGLWDKEKLDTEFIKAKAFYYNSQVEKIDLDAYFAWKASLQQNDKVVCPYANLWQNKSKVSPVVQINGTSFVMSDKPKGTGLEILTLSSPKSQNVFFIDRLHELDARLKEGIHDSQVTSFLISTTIADSSADTQTTGTSDTKVVSKGLAYQETSQLVSGSDLRQNSLHKLSDAYMDTVRYLLDPSFSKLTVSISNGQIPLDSVYLLLNFRFMRVITENALLDFQLKVSHAPIPPLLLFSMARTRSKHPLPAGFDLYLSLAAPNHSRLRGPELLRLGLADVFVPEAKLGDAIDIAKKLAVCPAPDTSAAIQLAMAIYHTYAGPNRFSVWEKSIETVFGDPNTFDDLEIRLRQTNNNWSKAILAHWQTLPPVLLRVIFRAVKEASRMDAIEVLNFENKLNAKWRQTEDYRAWLRNQSVWTSEHLEKEVDSYFMALELPASKESVVYKPPQSEEDNMTLCPVTGQKASSGNVCPVASNQNVCPVTGQTSSNGCPVAAAAYQTKQ
ncbi:3-hydroxyisobutyryl-CoA hydrolase, mitochondrial [Choanephora cucurbitarum]|uniref:3-hydroxyisobutyryl-CoA hydrolase, mitochondrial n=1 Tax=Choanephora cucurbitarum TaxID=101091 RepID=A0A1C7NHE1_9FUNG|nr:3-hydroxyisobutyryl-CoA hydrolase, mitochondrial [Choanephora cucurbitarum]